MSLLFIIIQKILKKNNIIFKICFIYISDIIDVNLLIIQYF